MLGWDTIVAIIIILISLVVIGSIINNTLDFAKPYVTEATCQIDLAQLKAESQAPWYVKWAVRSPETPRCVSNLIYVDQRMNEATYEEAFLRELDKMYGACKRSTEGIEMGEYQYITCGRLIIKQALNKENMKYDAEKYENLEEGSFNSLMANFDTYNTEKESVFVLLYGPNLDDFLTNLFYYLSIGDVEYGYHFSDLELYMDLADAIHTADKDAKIIG